MAQVDIKVSIHAPARGATFAPGSSSAHRAVSIHAPARGATGFSGGSGAAVQFQSTHPHGVRRRGIDQVEADLAVSIHAPARGATTSIAI